MKVAHYSSFSHQEETGSPVPNSNLTEIHQIKNEQFIYAWLTSVGLIFASANCQIFIIILFWIYFTKVTLKGIPFVWAVITSGYRFLIFVFCTELFTVVTHFVLQMQRPGNTMTSDK